MENILKNVSYHPVVNAIESFQNYDYWKNVETIYYSENPDFIQYWYHYLHYINRKFSIPNNYPLPFEKTFPHGASYIQIYFDSRTYRFLSPFVKIQKETTKIPLYRKVAELNFSELILSRIISKENKLYFYYEDKLERSDPYKIFETIDEICYINQLYIDFFIEKFNATFIQKPDIQLFSEKKLEQAYQQYTDILEECFRFYYRWKEINYFNNIKSIFLITLFKINYLFRIQGNLRIQVLNLIDELYKDKNAQQQVENTFPKLEELKKIDKKKFKRYIYKFEYFVFPFKRGNIYTAQNFFGEPYRIVKEWMSKRYYIDVTTYTTSLIYDFLDIYYVERELQQYLHEVLKDTANRDWEYASHELMKMYENIINNSIPSLEKITRKIWQEARSLVYNRTHGKQDQKNIQRVENRSIFSKLKNFFH